MHALCAHPRSDFLARNSRACPSRPGRSGRGLTPPPPPFPTSLHEAVNLVHAVATEAPDSVPIAASLRDAVATLRASLHPTPLDQPGTLSQTSASLQREAVHLIADQEAFEALVHEHKQAFLADPDQRARIQWAAVRWMLHQLTLHDPLVFPGSGQSWEAVLLALIQKRLDRIAIMEECYDQGSDFSGRLLTGYDYGTPQASSYISHGQSSQSAG